MRSSYNYFDDFYSFFFIALIQFIFLVLYYIFTEYSYFVDTNSVTKKNNIKTFTLFSVITLSLIVFIKLTILIFILNKNYFVNLTSNIFVPLKETIYVTLGKNYFDKYLVVSLNKFNIPFLYLFSILFPIVFVFMSNDYNNVHLKNYIYMYVIFVLSYILLVIENIILFYFIYELILILVYFTINLSSNSRGSYEALNFFISWAILGSILVGLGITMLVVLTNSFIFSEISLNKLTLNESYFIYFLFFFGFGIKLSIWPFWYWLPKAHVEVSVGMSIFLSCVLIKLSLFCLLTLQHLLTSEIPLYIFIIFPLYAVIDIIFRFINLKDLKAIIAYGSVLHTNLLVILIHLDSFKIIKNITPYIWGHSLSTASLFILVFLIESRYSTRNIIYLSGMWYLAPKLAITVFLNLLLFLDLPLFIFFWGEIWLWITLFDQIFIVSLLVLFLVNVIYLSIFFKFWWNILFGLPEINILNKVNLIYLDRETNFIIFFILFIQLVLGVQPILLSYIGGIYT